MKIYNHSVYPFINHPSVQSYGNSIYIVINWLLTHGIDVMWSEELGGNESPSSMKKNKTLKSDSLFLWNSGVLAVNIFVFDQIGKFLTRYKIYSSVWQGPYMAKNYNDGELLFLLLTFFTSKSCLNTQALYLLTLISVWKIHLVPHYFCIHYSW